MVARILRKTPETYVGYSKFDMVPSARAYLSLMRDVSEDWKNIIDHWDELEKQYRKEEHNPSGCAPKTYRILKRLKEGNHA